jgi:hypothetical protein
MSVKPSELCEELLAVVKATAPYSKRTPRDVFQGRVGEQPQIAGDRYVQIVPQGARRNAQLLDNTTSDLQVDVQTYYRNTVDNWARCIDDQALLCAAIDEWVLAGLYAVTIDAASVSLVTEDVIQGVISCTLIYKLEANNGI